MVWSLLGAWWLRVMAMISLMSLRRVAAYESPNHRGPGAQRRVGLGGGLARGGDGLWRCKGWETSGSQTPTKTGTVRWADGLQGPGRDGPSASAAQTLMRGRKVPRSLALAFASR